MLVLRARGAREGPRKPPRVRMGVPVGYGYYILCVCTCIYIYIYICTHIYTHV